MYLHPTSPQPSLASVFPSNPPGPSAGLTDTPTLQHDLPRILAEVDDPSAPVAPPTTKRGALTTNTGVHWLALSHDDPTGRAFCGLLGVPVEEWLDQQGGMAHYPRTRRYGRISVGYGGDARNGSHMVMSGVACEEWESRPGFTTWRELATRAEELGFRVTRLDLYKDVRDDSVTWEECERKWRSGEVTSRAQEARQIEGLTKGCGDDNEGGTLGIGSRQSGTYERIYDRAKEEARKLPEEEQAEWRREHGPWTRIEVELKHDQAEVVWREIAEKGFRRTTVGSVINRHTEFKDSNAMGKNGYRVPVWEAWRKVMETPEKLRRCVEAVVTSLAQCEYHFERQWGPNVYMMWAYHDFDWQWLVDLMLRVAPRVTANHYCMVREARLARDAGVAP